METSDHFLQDPWLLRVNSVPKMNGTDFENRKFVYDTYSIHFSVGRVFRSKKALVFLARPGLGRGY
jgi:hypothetical protein